MVHHTEAAKQSDRDSPAWSTNGNERIFLPSFQEKKNTEQSKGNITHVKGQNSQSICDRKVKKTKQKKRTKNEYTIFYCRLASRSKMFLPSTHPWHMWQKFSREIKKKFQEEGKCYIILIIYMQPSAMEQCGSLPCVFYSIFIYLSGAVNECVNCEMCMCVPLRYWMGVFECLSEVIIFQFIIIWPSWWATNRCLINHRCR